MHGKGTHKHSQTQTSQLLDQIGPVGQFDDISFCSFCQLTLIISEDRRGYRASRDRYGCRICSYRDQLWGSIRSCRYKRKICRSRSKRRAQKQKQKLAKQKLAKQKQKQKIAKQNLAKQKFVQKAMTSGQSFLKSLKNKKAMTAGQYFLEALKPFLEATKPEALKP